MINLSSKNPVLRFKLGKKILKAGDGLFLEREVTRKNGSRSRVRFVPQHTYKTSSGKTIGWYGPEKGAEDDFYGAGLGMGWYDNEGNRYTFKVNDTKPAKKQQSGTGGRTGNRTRGTTATTRTKPTIATPTYTVPSEVTDVKAMLQKLLDGKFYDQAYAQRVGNRAVDGKWGKWTDEAYKRYKTATLFNDGVANQGTPVTPGVTTTQEVVTPYTTNFDYTSNAGLKNLGFSNYNGLLNFVGLNPTNLFARDLIERFGTTDKWNLSDVEKVLGVSGRYRTGILGDYSDMARNMAEWATNKNKEAAAALSALKQNTPPVDNNISASTPSYDYSRYKFFSTYNPTNLFPSYTPTMGTTNTNYFTTYNSGNTLLPTNSINRFKLFKKGGPIRKFQRAGQITYPKWEVPRTVATGYGFQNANDTLVNLPDVTVTANYKQAARNKANKRNNTVANILNILWETGAFKGVKNKNGKEVSFHEAVDGSIGRMTREAISNAEKAGFLIDLNKGTITKIPSNKHHVRISKSEVISSGNENNNNSTQGPRFVTTSGAFVPTQVLERASESVKPYAEENADFMFNNPALILLEDMGRTSGNRISLAIFGSRPFRGRTITNLPSLLKKELIDLVKFAKSLGLNYFNSDVFKQMYDFNYASRNGSKGKDRSGVLARMNTPSARLEHTLGLYSFYTDENGNTIVVDTYDFNDDQKLKGVSGYSIIRNNIAGKFGSRSSEPDEGKIKYKINLGKI